MAKPVYKNVRIIRASSGDWRVVYEYEFPDKPGNYKRFYVRDGINYVHDSDEKEKAAQELKKDIEVALKNGFNPFLASTKMETSLRTEENRIISSHPSAWTMQEAIDNFLAYCENINLKKTTLKKYKSQTKIFIEWYNNLNINKLASEIDEGTMQSFLDYGVKFNKWSPRTYNNYIDDLSVLFARCEKLEKRKNKEIKYLYDPYFLEKKRTHAERNRYYTPAVASLIKNAVKDDIELFRYIKWIFYSCMRPKEIHLLQIHHIDLDSRQIKVAGSIGKTGDRFVPICDELHELIAEMKLDQYPLDYFVFGRHKKTSDKVVGDDYFRNKFRPYKIKLKLDENYTLYSWKHTRVISLISAGFDDNQVMTLTGHRDRAGFEAYKRELVVDNSSMKGKTIDF
ncbi:tyrosine-type recombinase/integrase [Sphingobacterium sp. LRF_L2]|uniref:tyrosine-type recombinase/integrase n=1 Tax=Sphingobacterium sp. LRF_L2 TaxID=3369421 RepID=UPI003F5E7175